MLDYAERILGMSAELDTRVKELTGEIAGVLLIGASMTIAEFLLPQILGEFRARYPKVLPRLIVANSETVENRVAEFTLDLGFIEAPSHLPLLVSDICTEDELQVLCAPGHPLAQQASVSPKHLLEHAFISREPGSGTREVTDKYLQDADIRPESLDTVMELGSPEAIKGLVSTGLGFAIMSRATISKEIRLGQLVALPLAPKLIRTLSVVYPKARFRSRLANTFIEFAKEKLRTGAER